MNTCGIRRHRRVEASADTMGSSEAERTFKDWPQLGQGYWTFIPCFHWPGDMPLGRWFSSAELIPRENCEQVVNGYHLQHLGESVLWSWRGWAQCITVSTAGGRGCAVLYTALREAFSDTVTLEARPEKRISEPCRCLGKENTRQRDQEVLRLWRWNGLDVVREPQTSVAKEDWPMGRAEC